MSNNQYQRESTPGFGGSMPGGGTQQPSDSQRQYEGLGGSSSNPPSNIMSSNQDKGYGMGQQNASSSYSNNYMGQNQHSSQPNYGQSQMHSSQGSYGQDRGPMGGDTMGGHSQSMSSQNQPPIGQRNYPPYPQPGYGGSHGMGHGMGQSLGGMGSGSMQHNYMSGGQSHMSSMPPVGMSSAPGTFQTSQGEKTYEPSMPGQMGPTKSEFERMHEDLPVSPEVMREFEEKATRSRQYKQTEIFAAILLKNEEDSIKVINYLLKKGVSLTAVDTLEQTALFYASRDGKLKVLNLLLEGGCDPNHRDQYGQTAIYYAARENQLDIAQRLIDGGADLNNEDMHQQTCLFYAAKQGNIDM